MAHNKVHASNKAQQSDVVLTKRYQQPKHSNFFNKINALFPETLIKMSSVALSDCVNKESEKKVPDWSLEVVGVYSGPWAVLHPSFVENC